MLVGGDAGGGGILYFMYYAYHERVCYVVCSVDRDRERDTCTHTHVRTYVRTYTSYNGVFVGGWGVTVYFLYYVH